MRIAVISDIHANLLALDSALKSIASRGADEIVILGDILGYGIDVNDVVSCVGEACRFGNVTLLRGNHDSLYLKSCSADAPTYEKDLPLWIKESINFTREHLDMNVFEKLPFEDSYVFKDILFAHANPFGVGDWRYLNTQQDHELACATLADLGCFFGIFGHTHRNKIFESSRKKFLDVNSGPLVLDSDKSPFVINAGSVGQPRESHNKTSRYMMVDVKLNGLVVDFVPVLYDIDSHINRIQISSMSADTKVKLISFYL